MRLLLLHVDTFSFAVGGEARTPNFTPDPAEARATGEVTNALVAFTAVEKVDESAPDDIVAQAADAISRTAARVGAGTVVVYPYAHLSSTLSAASFAAGTLRAVEAALKKRLDDLDVVRAPFGYYKSFRLDCKGHPLSELSRTLVPSKAAPDDSEPPAQEESAAVLAEKDVTSEWRIYLEDGSYVPADEYSFAGRATPLAQLYAYEREGNREAEDAPPHIRLMRDHQLVDYESASDTGNMRWYPSGTLIKRLLENRVTDLVTSYGGLEVETPLMYDYAHPALSKYLQRFPARQYLVKSEDRDFFLRFAACFGQYMIMHDMTASYRDLPVRLYELTHHSFRRERGGEVSGLRRLRAFTMPDMHTLVRDQNMAKEEFLNQVKLCLQWVNDLNLPCVPAIRFVQTFLDDHPDFMKELMTVLDRPALVEVWDERFFYFVAKFELNFIDNAGKAACLSTVQIDVENCERFGITYVAEDASKCTPLLLHTSVSGSVDRNVYALLEHQAREMTKGQKAEWPTWLAPTQVRLLPVAPDHNEGALELAGRLPFRVDVDDRDLRLGKKIREAEREWVPYVVVVGDRELAGEEQLTVRPRTGEQFTGSLDDLITMLEVQTAGRPKRPLNSSKLLSQRPTFVG